jgi:hypothetical protein
LRPDNDEPTVSNRLPDGIVTARRRGNAEIAGFASTLSDKSNVLSENKSRHDHKIIFMAAG